MSSPVINFKKAVKNMEIEKQLQKAQEVDEEFVMALAEFYKCFKAHPDVTNAFMACQYAFLKAMCDQLNTYHPPKS